jgi:hypothetical protein
MDTFFNKDWTIVTVNSKIEELRYGLEMSIDQSKVVDEDSVISILHNLTKIQKTLDPFKGAQIFMQTFPQEYSDFLSTVTTLGELFLDEPTLSVDQMKLEIQAERDIVKLAPYLVTFERKLKDKETDSSGELN